MALPNPLAQVFVGDPLPAALNAARGAINAIIGEVQQRIPFPAGAATGDLLRYDGTKWVTTDTRFFEGEGEPNGVVAAPVGSRYVDKLATQGAVEWVKTSGGDSNEGWTTTQNFYSLNGQSGTTQLTGAAGVALKTATVQLDPAIFRGVAPGQIHLTPQGGSADYAHVYLNSKTATQFVMSTRRIDGKDWGSSSGISVHWTAII